jgi:hypothetical protein
MMRRAEALICRFPAAACPNGWAMLDLARRDERADGHEAVAVKRRTSAAAGVRRGFFWHGGKLGPVFN